MVLGGKVLISAGEGLLWTVTKGRFGDVEGILGKDG